jgi:hypothetical protein
MVNDVLIQYKELVNGIKLVTIFGLIALDVILGIINSILDKTFDCNKISDFLGKDIIGLVIGYYAVGVFVLFEPSYSLAISATWVIIIAKLTAGIISKLKELGVNIKN